MCERWLQTLLSFPHSILQVKCYFLYLKILITYGECTCSSGMTVMSAAIRSLGFLVFALWCFWEQDKMNICFFIQLLPFFFDFFPYSFSIVSFLNRWHSPAHSIYTCMFISSEKCSMPLQCIGTVHHIPLSTADSWFIFSPILGYSANHLPH